MLPEYTSSPSTTSSIILSQGNVSTTGLSAVDGDYCQPNHEPLKWSKEFSNFLKDGQEQCHGAKDFPPLMSLLISSSEVTPNIQSSDKVCKIATKTMSSVPSLNTEDPTSNKISSVNDSAKDCTESIENLSISTITDYTHTLGSDRVMIKKKRSDYLPWYNSSVSLSSIKEAKRTQCEAIKKRHEELGSNWTVGNTYSQQHFETGHEDMMWVFSNSQVLNEIHTFMQVKRVYDFCQQSNPVSIQVRKVLRARDVVFNSDIVQECEDVFLESVSRILDIEYLPVEDFAKWRKQGGTRAAITKEGAGGKDGLWRLLLPHRIRDSHRSLEVSIPGGAAIKLRSNGFVSMGDVGCCPGDESVCLSVIWFTVVSFPSVRVHHEAAADTL